MWKRWETGYRKVGIYWTNRFERLNTYEVIQGTVTWGNVNIGERFTQTWFFTILSFQRGLLLHFCKLDIKIGNPIYQQTCFFFFLFLINSYLLKCNIYSLVVNRITLHQKDIYIYIYMKLWSPAWCIFQAAQEHMLVGRSNLGT